MKTIASQVSEYVKTKPYLSTALSQGIINLTSLAREIQPEIEKWLLENEVDLGVTVLSSKPPSELKSEKLLELPMVLIQKQ